MSGRAALQRRLSGDLLRLETRTRANKGIDGLPALFQREFQAINFRPGFVLLALS